MTIVATVVACPAEAGQDRAAERLAQARTVRCVFRVRGIPSPKRAEYRNVVRETTLMLRDK